MPDTSELEKTILLSLRTNPEDWNFHFSCSFWMAYHRVSSLEIKIYECDFFYSAKVVPYCEDEFFLGWHASRQIQKIIEKHLDGIEEKRISALNEKITQSIKPQFCPHCGKAQP